MAWANTLHESLSLQLSSSPPAVVADTLKVFSRERKVGRDECSGCLGPENTWTQRDYIHIHMWKQRLHTLLVVGFRLRKHYSVSIFTHVMVFPYSLMFVGKECCTSSL